MQTLKTYELTLFGYDGDIDKTDHLIKWVVASSLDIILDYAHEQGWYLEKTPEVIFDGVAMTIEDGVDAVLE